MRNWRPIVTKWGGILSGEPTTVITANCAVLGLESSTDVATVAKGKGLSEGSICHFDIWRPASTLLLQFQLRYFLRDHKKPFIFLLISCVSLWYISFWCERLMAQQTNILLHACWLFFLYSCCLVFLPCCSNPQTVKEKCLWYFFCSFTLNVKPWRPRIMRRHPVMRTRLHTSDTTIFTVMVRNCCSWGDTISHVIL